MTRPVILSIFIAVMTFLGIIGYSIHRGFDNDLALKTQCMSSGGTLTSSGNCVFSRVGSADGNHP